MKIFKHIIKGIIWTVVGLYIVIISLVHIPATQRQIGNLTASVLSEKLGTTVCIGKVDLGFLNRIIIDDVIIYDQQDKEMLKSARISAKIDLGTLADNKIAISTAQLFGTHLRLYQVSEKSTPNFQFVIDSLASKDDNSEKPPLDLRVGTFIMQHSSIQYDRYDLPETGHRFNPAHLKVTDISAHISLKAFNNDSINAIVKKLALKEQSGLQINRLSFKLEGNRSGMKLQDFNLRMPETSIRLNDIKAEYTLSGNTPVKGSLRYSGGIAASTICPADFSPLLPLLKNIRTALTLSADFNGTDTGLNVAGLNMTAPSGELNVALSGWIADIDNNPKWALKADGMTIAPGLAGHLCQALGTDEGTAATIARIGQIHIDGAARSDGNVIKSTCRLTTQHAGDVDIEMEGTKDRTFKAGIHTNGVNLGSLLDNDKWGTIATTVNLRGSRTADGKTSVTADGAITALELNGYQYKDIAINGTLQGSSINGTLNVNDPNLEVSMEGTMSKAAGRQSIRLNGAIHRFSPAETKLTEQWGDARFDADISADFTAGDLNDATGFFAIDNFRMTSADKDYGLEQLKLASGFDDDGIHYITMSSDFGKADIKGHFKLNTIAQSVKSVIKKKLPTIPGLETAAKHPSGNKFSINADINDTEWLKTFFGIPIETGSRMLLRGRVDDTAQELAVDCDIPYLKYDDDEYKNIEIDMTSTDSALDCCIGVTKVMGNGHNLDLRLTGNAADDHLTTSLTWDNNAEKRMSGTLNAKTRFFVNAENKDAAEIEVLPSHINMHDATWSIKPSTITYTKNNIHVGQFAITNADQHIIINGTASESTDDSLLVDLQDIDVEYILELVNFHAVDFSGKATGRAFISAPFGDMSANGNITVGDFKFENGRMGTLNAYVDWGKEDKQINIHATADDGPYAKTHINGYVSPAHSQIDLGIRADGTYIDFMRSFTGSFMKDLDGRAYGEVRLAGPLKAINLTGSLVVDGSMTISSTNCRYTLRKAVVDMIPDEICLNNIPIYDIHDRKGTVNGSIYHHNLSNLSYDINVRAENLLAYNFQDFGDDTFYGTVYGTGDVDINGRSGELNIDINVTPQQGSLFVYNVSNPDAISDQGFIHWNDITPSESDTVSQHTPEAKRHESVRMNFPTDTHINFRINCTPDATVKILMDSRTNDYITLRGNGALRATYYNKGAFNMFGTYVVDNGTYGITIQDILKKNFTFKDGGTIVFGGDPYDASLNLQAIYTVNGVSLSDLNIGNSFSSNTIRVNCLMNIGGQPKEPQVSFDLDMPTVSSDEKQMIRSIINSEDEMNQQVIYLLGIGRFYPQESNNATAQDEKQQSQTSLAMQSLLSGTISSQINSVLSTVINSNNWNFGANISTGDEGWNNAEYEGLLSGRLLNNRLLINGQFGYRDNVNNASTSFIGDFDIRYLLFPNGSMAVNIYNKTNDRYFTKSSLNTQGIGLIMKKDFNGLKDLFGIRKKRNKQKQQDQEASPDTNGEPESKE